MEQEIHFLTHEFSPFTGGIGIYIEELALACAAGGSRSTVWAPDYGNEVSDDLPFQVKRIRMRGKQDWICRWKLGRSFSAAFPVGKISGTVVLAEPGPIRWWMYGKLTRPPQPERLVVILHGSELKLLTRLPHRRLMLGGLLRKADRVGVVSNQIREMLLSVFPELEDKVSVVPGAVRSAWANDAPEDLQRKKEVIEVGRVHPRKGQLELVEAMGQLPEEVRDETRLRMIGPVSSKDYAKQVSETARRLGVNLEMTGILNEAELKDAYRQAAVTVMPSQQYKSSVEGLGIALLEAQHFGCPVIGTDIGGIREAMLPGKSGILVPPANNSALAGAILQVLSDPRMAKFMGEAGARAVRDNFSWEKNARVLGLI